MKFFCYRHSDKDTIQLAYTIRYFGTIESAEEITEFIEKEIPDAEITFTGNTYCFFDSGRKVTLPEGSLLVLTPGHHFKTYTKKEFFERYYIC